MVSYQMSLKHRGLTASYPHADQSLKNILERIYPLTEDVINTCIILPSYPYTNKRHILLGESDGAFFSSLILAEEYTPYSVISFRSLPSGNILPRDNIGFISPPNQKESLTSCNWISTLGRTIFEL